MKLPDWPARSMPEAAMMFDNRAIIAKIRKLLALAKGSTEHEAASALAKARAMMDAYGISDGDVLIVAENQGAAVRTVEQLRQILESKGC